MGRKAVPGEENDLQGTVVGRLLEILDALPEEEEPVLGDSSAELQQVIGVGRGDDSGFVLQCFWDTIDTG